MLRDSLFGAMLANKLNDRHEAVAKFLNVPVSSVTAWSDCTYTYNDIEYYASYHKQLKNRTHVGQVGKFHIHQTN